MKTQAGDMMIQDRGRVAQLVKVSPGSGEKVLDIITEAGAILEGHFSFLDCHAATVLRFRSFKYMPNHLDYVARLLIEQAKIDRYSAAPLKILAPEMAGMFLAYAVVDALGLKNSQMVLAEASLRRQPTRYLYGSIDPGDRVVIVNDIDRTGNALRRLAETVQERSGIVVKALLFGVCNSAEHALRMAEMTVESHHLVELNLQTSPRDGCPMCKPGKYPTPVADFA